MRYNQFLFYILNLLIGQLLRQGLNWDWTRTRLEMARTFMCFLWFLSTSLTSHYHRWAGYFNYLFNIPLLEGIQHNSWNCFFMEREMLCYIIPSYMISSIGWICFNLCTYLRVPLAHMFCYTIIYVMVFE